LSSKSILTHRFVLSRYAEVTAALSNDRLTGGGDDSGAHVAVRDAARRAFSQQHLAEWREKMEASALALAAALPDDEPVDVVLQFAIPWTITLAGFVTATPASELPRLARLASQVFIAAAHATDLEMPDAARVASAELAAALSSMGAAAPIGVQAFVALTQTLPCFLGAAWRSLLDNRGELANLRADPSQMPRAVEELLRFAGPSRAVFRQAASDVRIGDLEIHEGDRIVLSLSAANRDPERFENPDRLDLTRDAAGHVAFGRGTHFCAGASMIRAATAAATAALIDYLATRDVERATQLDGFAIRGVTSLVVTPRRD
jgi:cytochrome P450